jgi:hypothetical protein
VAALFVDEPELKIARMNVAERDGHVSWMDMHHLVATPAGVEHIVARHELGLFTVEQYGDAFRAAGLDGTRCASRCERMMRPSLAPTIRAASTKSLWRSASISARTIRAG